MSIFKMFMVIGISVGQIYFITQFFNTKGKGKDINPFSRGMI
jgi:hypothetical protein